MAEVRLTPGAVRILDVASELFYRHGLHAVGVEGIAEASGLTKRTLYDRFGSKDELIRAYLRRRHDRWWARLEQRLDGWDDGPRTLALFDAYVEDVDDGERGCAFVNAAAELPRDHPVHGVIRDHKSAVRRRLGELVAGDAPQLEAPVRERLVEHLFLLLEGATVRRGIEGGTAPADVARELAAELLRGTGEVERRRPRGRRRPAPPPRR